MSDILIKGMEMPRDCPMCPLSHWNRLDEFTGCEVVNGKRFAVTNDEGYAQSNTRPSWCPITEIPPHGRLIDADKVIRKMKRLATKAWKWKLTDTVEHTLNMSMDILNHAPTVIESEEQENE